MMILMVLAGCSWLFCVKLQCWPLPADRQAWLWQKGEWSAYLTYCQLSCVMLHRVSSLPLLQNGRRRHYHKFNLPLPTHWYHPVPVKELLRTSIWQRRWWIGVLWNCNSKWKHSNLVPAGDSDEQQCVYAQFHIVVSVLMTEDCLEQRGLLAVGKKPQKNSVEIFKKRWVSVQIFKYKKCKQGLTFVEKKCAAPPTTTWDLWNKWGWVHILKFQEYKQQLTCVEKTCSAWGHAHLSKWLETMMQHIELFVLFAFLVFGSHYHVHSWHQVSWLCSGQWTVGRKELGMHCKWFWSKVGHIGCWKIWTLDQMDRCLNISEYLCVMFPSLIEQHEAKTFHLNDSTLLWDGEWQCVFWSTSNAMAPTK